MKRATSPDLLLKNDRGNVFDEGRLNDDYVEVSEDEGFFTDAFSENEWREIECADSSAEI